MKSVLSCCLLLGCGYLYAQPSPYTNAKFAPVTMTATAQTSVVVPLSKTGRGDAFVTGTVTLTGTALTTATFGVQGSADGGVSYNSLNLCPQLTPTTCATTATATVNGMYFVNLANIDHLKFVTSGTFTATNIVLTLSASPNGLIASRTRGAITYVGDVASFSSVAVTSWTQNYSCTAGNLVHVASSIFAASTTAGISSAPAATWTAEYITMPVRGDGSVTMQVWDSTCPATGSQAITVTSSVSTGIWIAVSELHGTSPSKFDTVASAAANSSSTGVTVNSTATFSNSAAIVDLNTAAGVGGFITPTPTAGYTFKASSITSEYGWQNTNVSSGAVTFAAGFGGGATAWLASISIFHL